MRDKDMTWRTDKVDEAFAYMTNVESWSVNDDEEFGIPYYILDEGEHFHHFGHVEVSRGVQPRIAVVDYGLWSPVESHVRGWEIVAHYPLGERMCPCEKDSDCAWCEGDSILYWGEEMQVALFMPFDDHRDDIEDQVARTLWLMAYSQEVEEAGLDDLRASGGEDWENVSPETPDEMFELAKEWILDVESTNNKTLSQIIQIVIGDDMFSGQLSDFGHALAMQMCDSGIGLSDWAYEHNIEHDLMQELVIDDCGITGDHTDIAYEYLLENGHFNDDDS